MRVRVRTELPPTRELINRIRCCGASEEDETQRKHLLKRLQKSCYLDQNYRPLDPKERLLAQYRNDGLVLFLGAGVGKESGIPGWQDLIQEVFQDTHCEYATVKRTFPSLLTQFDLAACQLGGQRSFITRLYECLYKGVKFKGLLERIPPSFDEQCTWRCWPEVLKELEKNKTLREVGDMLIAPNGHKPRRNPQVHAVLTVNVDNLLELFCQAKGLGRRFLTMVDRASVGDHPDAIPVYHLHGVLDVRSENVLRADCPVPDELLPDIVFREREYYETLADPTSFVNHTPQSYFQRLNVLFIGTSLDDLNIRRWLYNSFRERVHQRTRYLREFYCAPYQEEDARFEAELESVRHFWLRTSEEYDREKKWAVPQELVNSIMRNLGVEVIWCKSCEDLQSHIRELRKRGSVRGFGRCDAPCPG